MQTQATVQPSLIERVEERVLKLARELLKCPQLLPTENLIDHGATSFTAMLLLGRLRQELQGTLNGDRIKALRLDMLKEHLWQSTRELARSIIGIDENGNYLHRIWVLIRLRVQGKFIQQ